MTQRNRLIMGSAIGLAAIAVAIDHTRHRLPEPAATVSEQGDDYAAAEDETPCALTDSPCSLDDSPCSLDLESPCSL
jgi:hypothetical protein